MQDLLRKEIRILNNFNENIKNLPFLNNIKIYKPSLLINFINQ